MKVPVTLWTLIVFFLVVLILSLMFTIEPNNLEESYSGISEKHDQTSINLTCVILYRLIFKYVTFDEIKCFYAFSKYTTQNFIRKPHSRSVSWY